jgi:putative spermidine/putrescine transport system permease protein
VRLGLAGSRLGLVLAHLTVVLPYVVLVLAAGFDQRLGDLEDMARTMGLGTPRRLALVTLPVVRPTLAAAGLLGFLVSWSQYGLSLAIGGGLPMLPPVLLPFIRTDPQVAAALALEFLAPALAALAVAARASRHRS